MSVSNPVDSGGIGLNSFDRELQGFAEKLNTVGGWAEIMAEDSKNNTFDTEDNKRSDEPVEDDYSDVLDHGPPYKLQLLPRSQCDKDELYYFFGGENKVADMIFRDNNRVIITFKDIKDYAFYYREKDFKCNDVSIRAFRIQNNNTNRESHPYSRQNSQNQYQPQRDSYSRQGSFHDSSQSLASSHHGDRRQDYDRRYNNRKDYMPSSGYRDDSSRGNNRGRHRGGPRSHYDGPGEIQRSGSYSYDGNRPAPIFRSRTDDGLADRRQSGLMSRTSSQYSVNTEGEKPMAKKPSTRDIFGDAKPVDSTSRLNEVEAKMEGKKKQEAEKAEKEKKEKERLQQQQQQPQPNQQPQQAPPQQAPPSNPQPPMIPPYPFPTPGMFNHPPPNYYQSYPQYATPIVNMGPGGIHPPQHMTTPPPMYSANNNQPYRGEVKIVQRNSAEKETGPGSVSPPLDPEHPRQQMDRPPPSHPIETIKEEPSPLPPRRASQSDAKSDDKQSKQFNRPRTFQNSSHRGSFDGNRGGFNRGRGGSRGGRGGGQQKSKTDQTHPNQPEPKTPTTEAPPVAEATKETRAKDHHGSHASLNSRGGRGGGRGGRGGGGFHKQDNKERPPKAEGQKEQQKPKQGEKDKRKYSKEDPQKNTAVNPTKTEVKKEIPKAEEATPAVTTTKAESTPTTPVDAKEKKKEKKKKVSVVVNSGKRVQSAAKNATPLNGNKFAALLDADE